MRDRREALAQYYAAVTHIDEGVGRLLDELEARGLREDTLVVYTADHGLNCSHHGLWGKGNATRPPNMLEESIRVPLLLNRPGHVPAGHTSEHFVDHCDLYATLIDLAGLGRRPGTTGPGAASRPCSRTRRRCRTGARPRPGNMARRACGARSITSWCGRRQGQRELLFDLAADPRETRDLRADEPELAADARRAAGRLFRTIRSSRAQRPAGAPGPASQLPRGVARATATVAPDGFREMAGVHSKNR